MRFALRIVLYVIVISAVLTGALSALDMLFTGQPLTRGDVATDYAEMLVLSSVIVGSIIAVERLRGLEAEATTIRREFSEAAQAGREWRMQSEQLFQGLSEAVAAQFSCWNLTEAEADIAALILKGASHKDIARLRRTSEATIRQQAQSVYQKSGLANRSQLAAYFLEDLFDVAAARSALGRIAQPRH
ncbi:MAG: LuxR C-terminal-related transcriptional regulator [Paracoccaceae bacterium]